MSSVRKPGKGRKVGDWNEKQRNRRIIKTKFTTEIKAQTRNLEHEKHATSRIVANTGK